MAGRQTKHGEPSLRWGVVRTFAAAGAVILLVGAGGAALCRGLADWGLRSGSVAGVALARRLTPHNAASFVTDPSDVSALACAVAVNPRLASVWIELGLQAETSGDLPKAEKCLLAAARASRAYEPNWSLANFYFRRNDPERFWPWARKAAEMAYLPQTALFRLSLRLGRDPVLVLERVLPKHPGVLAQYLGFLLQEDLLDGAGRAFDELLPLANREHARLFAVYCERLLEAGRVDAAVTVWNASCERGILPFAPLDPSRGRSLTNGGFDHPPGAGGFDWRVAGANGLTTGLTESPRALRITLSGKQAERIRILQQALPVQPGRRYRLTCWARGMGAPRQSGLRWIVEPWNGSREIAAAEMQAEEASWRQSTFDFEVPDNVNLVRLALDYRRTQGSTRIEGDLWVRQASLEPGGVAAAAPGGKGGPPVR